jgi:small subunit ribosomal protein S8e
MKVQNIPRLFKMTKYQGRSARLSKRKKRKNELGSDHRHPKKADEEERKNVPIRGGKEKTVASKVKFANVAVKGKTKKVEITAVEDNPANKDYKRENIVSLGGVVKTELGEAKVTSRPNQDGVVNAVLLK